MVNILALGGTLRPNSLSYIALQIAAEAASNAGATVESLSLYELDLPMYKPDKSWDDYGKNVHQMIEAIRRADGIMLSTGAYNGTLAGATKNALDFVQFASGDEKPYFHNRAVGLISVAGGEMAAAHTLTTLIHIVHSLRGMVVPMTIPIMQGWKKFSEGELQDTQTRERLETLGQETVRIASALNVAVPSI